MSGSHRSGDDRTDNYRSPGGGRGDGPRADSGEYGSAYDGGGRGEHAPYPGQAGRTLGTPGDPAGTGGYPRDPLNSPAGSPTAGYPTVGGTGGYPSSGGYPQVGASGESGAYGSDTGRYSASGYGSDTGRYSAGGYPQGGASGAGGGYGADSGRYSAGGGAYGSDPGRSATGGYPQAGTSGGSGAYGGDPGRSASGGYPQGDYGSDTDRYATSGYPQSGASGGYRSETGPYGTRTSDRHEAGSGRSYASGSGRGDGGGYFSDSPRDSSGRSGGYRTGTGSHRIVREEREGRRWGLVLGGALVGIAACALAVFVIVSPGGSENSAETNQIVGSGATESASAGTAERSLVPDSCTIVGTDLIDKLAPNAERNEADNYQGNDRQTQCVWGVYTGDEKRQLTIELRAIEAAGGKTATATATATFESERKVDEAGEALLDGQKLTDKRRLEDVGDQGYVVYSVDDAQGTGEAIANVRFVNVLITIHYSGSDEGDPLSYEEASGGAVEVVEAVLAKLEAS